MFTGIVEGTGIIKNIDRHGNNISFWISSFMSCGLQINQSVSHNGVCLTIEDIQEGQHKVTAVEETLSKTNLGSLQEGDVVNLERCLQLNHRLDGHLVQGHVDTTGICTNIVDKNGSREFQFSFNEKFAGLVIEKGSVAINGISLTAFNITQHSLWVAIIPYTFEHTNMFFLKKNDIVNIEFDMIGKYMARAIELQTKYGAIYP